MIWTLVILERDFYKRVVVILFATFILALNYNLFLVPNNLVIGGTSGLAIIFSRLFGWDTSVFLYVSSFVLLFFSFFCLGSHDTKISLVGGLFYPLMVTFSAPLALFLRSYFSFDNILLTILVSSFVYGLATGLIYKVGFNTGGADILVKIVNKFFHLPEGRCMFFVNGFIILFGISTSLFSFIILIRLFMLFCFCFCIRVLLIIF